MTDTETATGARESDTVTADGALVRLIIADAEVVGAVAIRSPCPWVYRTAYLVPEDVD